MTGRARAYLVVVVVRHVVLGVLCIATPEHFTSGSYDGLKNALPFVQNDGALVAWGIIFGVVGLLNAIPAYTGRETYARAGLLLSAVATGCWLGGFIAAAVTGTSAGPSGIVIWANVVAIDLISLRDPMRNPFEPIVKQMMALRRGR